MTTSSTPDQFLAFRFPEFRLYVGATFIFASALLMQEVIIGYELYKITGDPFAIALVGLVQAVPFIGLSLYGGHLADVLSKRKVLIISLLAISLCSLGLVFASQKWPGEAHVNLLQIIIYVVVFITGTCYAFYSPTKNSLMAFLVPRRAYESAATWGSTGWHMGTIVGPGISGFVYIWVGFSGTILLAALLMASTIVFWLFIKDYKIPPTGEKTGVWQKIKEGLRFVRKTRMLLYSISLDLFSVLFGGVIAILPVFAEDVLHVGADGLGILRAAPAIGALMMLVVLSRLSLLRRAWRTLLVFVAGFGVATLVFAISKNFYLSVAALFFTGAFDAVSMVIRSTIMQLLVPDEMRGRVGSVNGIFISASNELGAFESGTMARLMGAVPSVIFGGVASLAIVAFVWWKTRDLLDEDLRQVV